MMVEMYGIPNCDTIKKARKWLEAEGIGCVFHDYKKEGANPALLASWAEKVGWELLLNRRGTTWRKLPEDVKEGVDEGAAIRLMVENPSLIKRPVLVTAEGVAVGFKAEDYEVLFR